MIMNTDNRRDLSFHRLQGAQAPDSCDPSFETTLPETLRIFKNALGYDLRFERKRAKSDSTNGEKRGEADDVSPLERTARFEVGEPNEKIYGELRLSRCEDEYPKVEWASARALASALATTIGENYRWRDAVVDREAKLASFTSLFPEAKNCACSQIPSVGIRLREALRSGAKALGDFVAAGLYLLDDDTTTLRTTAVWRLPEERLLDPPRPLRGARAEVEALLGSAVVINDDELAEEWKAPEIFPCSVCIPIISDSLILGVAWFFSNANHKLGARETEILDLVGKRLVDELERDCERIRKRRDERRRDNGADDEELERWIDALLNETTVDAAFAPKT